MNVFDGLLPPDWPADAREAAFEVVVDEDDVWHAECRFDRAKAVGAEIAGTRRGLTWTAKEVADRGHGCRHSLRFPADSADKS